MKIFMTKTFLSWLILDIVLTTAHKSKGLEFSTVELQDDFIDIDEDDFGKEDVCFVPLPAF